MKKTFPLSKVYALLEPGPVILVSTSLNGKNNVMPMSWHTRIDLNPPLVGCVISDRNFTFAALKKTKECVLNIPTAEIAKKAWVDTSKKARIIHHLGKDAFMVAGRTIRVPSRML